MDEGQGLGAGGIAQAGDPPCSQWEDQIALPCPETTLALSEIYERIEFGDAL